MNLNLEEINQLISKLEKDSKAIKSEILKLCWYMRGGLTLSEAYAMDLADRSIIVELVEENMKMTKESGLPFF